MRSRFPLDLPHLVDILHRALFAGGDDQPLRPDLERHLRLRWRLVVRVAHRGLDVDKRAQALVLAEVAARRFVARGLVQDLRARVQADKRAHATVVPQPSGFERRANRARLAAVLVHDHFRLHFLTLEARLDEVHLRLHRRQVVLRPALEQEARPDRREVGDLRHVQARCSWAARCTGPP